MTAQLDQLITKLQEIFQINQPDLDFGIYRILNSRQTQINEFLQKTLPNKIKTAFNGNFEQANSVYNHLYTFFSRYYDQGDFISQRRYKGDTYAIPYAGEEVLLHWANKDQYYTKSGENFSNYAFTLENGKKVQFRLVEADTAKDNRKDNDQVRVFALIEPKIKTELDENGDEIQTDIFPIEEKGDLLTIRFEYKAIKGTEKQRQKFQKEYILQAVEKIKTFAVSDDFQEIFTLSPTNTNETRILLEKYLTDYTAKNTADYFIHKNLGKFLNQELDFYIKNEVMNLDNIQDNTDFSHIEQNLQTIKTLKTAAKEIIAFLAQLEDFQKKLWLKKKFVAGCHYLITLDHLNEAQVQAALDNPKQTAQWQALFNVDTTGLIAAEICKKYPHLVVDTSLFDPTFQANVLNHLHNLDEKTNGLLIHSDNFQALNLLQERYKEQVKCIYIDPPYNTESDRKEGRFIYKDNFAFSSWLSLLSNRLEIARNLLSEQGVLLNSIDDNEQARLKMLCDEIFGSSNFISNTPRLSSAQRPAQENYISITHDYVLIYAKNKIFDFNHVIDRDLSDIQIDQHGTYIKGDTSPILASSTQGYSEGGDYDIEINGKIYQPVNSKGERRRWLWTKERMKKALELGIIVETKSSIRVRNYIDKEFQVGTNILVDKDPRLIMTTYDLINSKYANNLGTERLRELNLGNEFDFPKPKNLIDILLKLSTSPNQENIVLDFFGGSGTTADAVIELNRNFKGYQNKYILVEQGEYFDTVLKPRVQKVIFAKEWKDGKPQSNNGTFDGVSQIVKVLKLESYEDTLNNLELKQPTSNLFAQNQALQNDYLLHYMLDIESRESLLNTQHFAKPFDYQLNITTTSAGAYEAKTIDLVETFNYLIGLQVSEIDDQREKRGRVIVKGQLTNGDNALIIWRDCEKVGYKELNDFIRRNSYGLEDKLEHSTETFDVVYINGDHNVPTVFTDSDESVKTLKVRSIEAEFLSKMFE